MQKFLNVMVFILFVTALLQPEVAHARTSVKKLLVEAEDAYLDLEYELCREKSMKSLRMPAKQQQRVTSFRLLGLCEIALDDADASMQAFSYMLAIDPKAKLPKGLSPRFKSPFMEAKGQWLGRPAFIVDMETDTVHGDHRELEFSVTDRPGMIKKMMWRDFKGRLQGMIRVDENMLTNVPTKSAKSLVFMDRYDGEIFEFELKKLAVNEVKSEVSVQQKDLKNLDNENDEDNRMWLSVGGGSLAVLLVAGVGGAVVAGLVTGYLPSFKEPVAYKSGVSFQK